MVWGFRGRRRPHCCSLLDGGPSVSPQKTNGLAQCARLVARLMQPGALVCCRGLKLSLKLSGSIVAFITAAGASAFLPPAASYSLAGLVLATTSRGRRLLPFTRHAPILLAPLRPFQGPVMTLGLMRLTLPYTLPAVWRAVQYWQRMLPITASYIRVSIRARQLSQAGHEEAAQQLWEHQHEWGAQQMFDMLADIKGFYLKLGQILATKTEMLPRPYTTALSGLLDSLPPEPFHRIKHTMSKGLGRTLDEVYVDIDPFPLASATIAQVHAAQLAFGNQQHVAVKVQHRHVQRMMHADLANMRLGVDLCEWLGIDLGFDLSSVVKEYQVAVPGEFDFLGEAACMSAIKHSLDRRAHLDLPDLKRVMIPDVHMNLCSDKVLVMELLQGVPLLHVAHMQPAVRSQLMHSLVLAFGVQILCDGVFHTDPHPGNLMACVDPATGDMQVGLLDFGQVKRLSGQERYRVAQLVLALATRDNHTVRSTCRSLIAAYILFDTRMDIPEALQSPADPAAHQGWRTTRVPKLPRDLFMVMRVITLLRGVMVSMAVHDVSSALVWRPLAEQAVKELQGHAAARPAPLTTHDTTPTSPTAYITPGASPAILAKPHTAPAPPVKAQHKATPWDDTSTASPTVLVKHSAATAVQKSPSGACPTSPGLVLQGDAPPAVAAVPVDESAWSVAARISDSGSSVSVGHSGMHSTGRAVQAQQLTARAPQVVQIAQAVVPQPLVRRVAVQQAVQPRAQRVPAVEDFGDEVLIDDD